MITLSNITQCKECGSANLTWHAGTRVTGQAPEGRLRSSEVESSFFLGCDDCSETLATRRVDTVVELLNAQRKPTGPHATWTALREENERMRGLLAGQQTFLASCYFLLRKYVGHHHWLHNMQSHIKQINELLGTAWRPEPIHFDMGGPDGDKTTRGYYVPAGEGFQYFETYEQAQEHLARFAQLQPPQEVKQK